MTRWTRLPATTYCGSCAKAILPGDPVFEVQTGGRALWRCPNCAWESVPSDLPPLPVPRFVTIKPSPKAPKFVPADVLARDWKLKQSRDDA